MEEEGDTVRKQWRHFLVQLRCQQLVLTCDKL